jgi:hypothetical protein
LKLPTMTAACATVAARCAQENVDHLGFPLPLREWDWLERERRAAAPSVNPPMILELMRCESVDRRANVLLIGGSGTGKTHLATSWAAEACARGKRVRFDRVTELATQVLEAREERQWGRLKPPLAKRDLRVLDERGDVPARTIGAEPLVDVRSTA